MIYGHFCARSFRSGAPENRLQFAVQCCGSTWAGTYAQFALDKVLRSELADVQADGAGHQSGLLVLDGLVLDDGGRYDLPAEKKEELRLLGTDYNHH